MYIIRGKKISAIDFMGFSRCIKAKPVEMFFDLLSTCLSTPEAQKRLHDKQPQAELKKKGVLIK